MDEEFIKIETDSPSQQIKEEKDDRDRRDERSSRGERRSRHSERSNRSERRHRSKSPRDRERGSERDSHSSRRKRSKSPVGPRKPIIRANRVSMWDTIPQPGQVIPQDPMAAFMNTAFPQVKAGQTVMNDRRLYVGDIPPNVTEDQLAEFFHTAMITAKLTTSESCVNSVQINREKNFAFLEFMTPQEASAGMSFDGIVLQGHSLKVRRPKDYNPGDGEFGAGNEIAGIIHTNVPDSPHKIFVGGLPSYLNEDQVKELLGSFGSLRAFNLVKDAQTGLSKGYAFAEYRDPSVTDRACSALNNMALGDKTLLVQRASLGTGGGIVKVGPNGQVGTQVEEIVLDDPSASNLLNMSVPVASIIQTLPGITPQDVPKPTQVVELFNMLNIEELTPDEIQFLRQDIGTRCQQFGKIEGITIPALDPEQGDILPGEAGIGRVFIKFSHSSEAEKCLNAITGQRYNGHFVVGSFYDTERYEKSDVRGPTVPSF